MQTFLKLSLDYIEQNLKADITIDELAKMANYSTGHFCRLFVNSMETTVGVYILKRRLDHVLVEIRAGRKIINVVLEYGFDTYAGFYKAFVKMYGCSPRKYISIYNNKKGGLFMQSIKEIINNWDIPNDLNIKEVTHTEWETGKPSQWKTWQIGEDYYIKTNERSKMIRNINIANALFKQGLVSEFLPIKTRQGNDYLDGENVFLLTKKIGEPLNLRPLNDNEIEKLEQNESRKENAFKLGQAIAKFHMALKSIQDDIKPWEGNLYEQGEHAISAVKDIGLKSSFFDDYRQVFSVLHEKLPKQLIHGNLCGDTAIYENGEIIGFKGFETYNLSFPRIYDITWGAGEITYQQEIDIYLNTLTQMFKGYDNISPLTIEEKQSIYYVICATYLKGQAYYIENESNLTSDLITRGNKALIFLADNKEKFMNLLH